MKDKILVLILGMLIGAVLTAGGFLVFGKNTNPSSMGERQNRGGMGNLDPSTMGNFIPGEMNGENIPQKPEEANQNQIQENSI